MMTTKIRNRMVFFSFMLLLLIEIVPRADAFALGGSFRQYLSKSRRRNSQAPLFALADDDQDANTIEKRSIENEIDNEDDDERDELVEAVILKLEESEGLWYSDDFYGPHGREWVKVSVSLVMNEKTAAATTALVATKVTGDPNIPAGCVTFRTKNWPSVGTGVPAEIHVRADPNDPNGFSWLSGELTLVNDKTMRLLCSYSPILQSQGTFYKENDEEEE